MNPTVTEYGADDIDAQVRATPRSGSKPTQERSTVETERDAQFLDCDDRGEGTDVFAMGPAGVTTHR